MFCITISATTTETVFSGLPTEAIVSSVEAVLSRQRELSESAKDNIRSRIASTIQSASLPDSNLTKDERQALKRLKTDETGHTAR